MKANFKPTPPSLRLFGLVLSIGKIARASVRLGAAGEGVYTTLGRTYGTYTGRYTTQASVHTAGTSSHRKGPNTPTRPFSNTPDFLRKSASHNRNHARCGAGSSAAQIGAQNGFQRPISGPAKQQQGVDQRAATAASRLKNPPSFAVSAQISPQISSENYIRGTSINSNEKGEGLGLEGFKMAIIRGIVRKIRARKAVSTSAPIPSQKWSFNTGFPRMKKRTSDQHLMQ